MTLPTARDYAGIHRVDVVCRSCDHWHHLDLADLVATGRGDVPLVRLALRCGECGGREFGVVVSGAAYPLGVEVGT